VLFFHTKTDDRRGVYLGLSGDIERQLRGAYARQYQRGLNQSQLANKLGVSRSVIHRRLMGKVNMQLDTLADMVWGLNHRVAVFIYPADTNSNCLFSTPSAMKTEMEMPETRPGQIKTAADRLLAA